MTTQSVLLTLLLGASPPDTDVQAPDIAGACTPVPPEPQRVTATPFADTRSDGSHIWGAEATYRLSSGDLGEAFMVVDSDGAGEAQLMINGEIIAHVAIESPTSSPAPVITTWMPEAVNYPPELIAELIRVDLPVVLAESVPQEFKCSAWGRKVMKAGRYLVGATACWTALSGLASCRRGGSGTTARTGDWFGGRSPSSVSRWSWPWPRSLSRLRSSS